MKQSFKDFLIKRNADTDTIQQATRYYLAERTDDLSPEEMRQRLIEATGDARAVDSALRVLERDAMLTERASLALLTCAWEEPGEAERIQGAVDDAKKKLPVIEAGIIAIVAMYCMYLLKTGGVKKQEKIVERGSDGSLKERQLTEFFGPYEPLSAVMNLIHPGKGK